MNIDKFKQAKSYLLGGGLGFAASAFIGLDGIRKSISFPQLFIGIGILVITEFIYFIYVHAAKR